MTLRIPEHRLAPNGSRPPRIGSPYTGSERRNDPPTEATVSWSHAQEPKLGAPEAKMARMMAGCRSVSGVAQ
jgi:hypothetical protein